MCSSDCVASDFKARISNRTPRGAVKASGQRNAMSDNAGMLLEWMERQYLLSSAAMLRVVSATELVKVRRHFG